MARKAKRGFLATWTMPLIMGPLISVGVVAYLYRDVTRNGDASQRPLPTMLDFGGISGWTTEPPAKRPAAGGQAVVDIGNVPPPGSERPAVRTGAAVNDRLLAPEQAEALPPPPDFDVMFPRVTVLDATHFRVVKDQTPLMVSIAGVAGPDFTETCTDTSGNPWKCGARARAELARLIGPRSVGCLNLVQQEEGTVAADCYVGARNVADWLVAQGWAGPIDQTNERLVKLMKEAEAAGRGRFGKAPDTGVMELPAP